MKKGQKFKIDRFMDGDIEEYTVQRVCKRHINVICNDGSSWSMPNDRIKDILKEVKISTIEDLLSLVTRDNFENFTMDLLLFLDMAVRIKEQNPEIRMTSMLWSNDEFREITGFNINGQWISMKAIKENKS